MSSATRCDSCNVVISEVLAFIQNKMEVMDQLSLIQICVSAFTAEDIIEAKNLLFSCVKSSKKKSQRKRDGKSRRDLEDIVGLFQELDPDDFPVFVVQNINKLPAVHWDHIDVSRFLKEILVLQKEVASIKQNYASMEELNALKNDLENMKIASIVNNFELTNVNTLRRGGSKMMGLADNYDSGPIGLLHIPDSVHAPSGSEEASVDRPTTKPGSSTMGTQLTCREINGMPADGIPNDLIGADAEGTSKPKTLSTPVRSIANSVGKSVPTPSQRKSFAQLACEEGEWKDKQPSEEWKMVQRKRHRNRLVTANGEAMMETESKFKAADITVPLFINNVHKCTSAEDISSYILRKTNITVSLEKIKPKQVREYDAYKVMVPRTKLPVFMDPKLWPDGISFRRFVSLFRRDAGVASALTK